MLGKRAKLDIPFPQNRPQRHVLVLNICPTSTSFPTLPTTLPVVFSSGFLFQNASGGTCHWHLADLPIVHTKINPKSHLTAESGFAGYLW